MNKLVCYIVKLSSKDTCTDGIELLGFSSFRDLVNLFLSHDVVALLSNEIVLIVP